MSTLNEDLEFSKNWENDEDFPTREYNEATVRENIQLLFDEIKDHINNKVTPAINDNMDRITSMGGGGMITHELLGDEIVEENNIKRGAITEYKYGPTSIPTSAFKNRSITAEKLHTATVDPYIAQRINAYPDATTSAHGLMSTSDKTKLNGIATGAEVNQNAFSNVAVGSTTIAADGKTDTLTLAAGANVTLTPDATNDKITIASTNTTYSAATTSAAGLMSAADKTKLNGIAAGANAYSLPTASSSTLGGVKVGSNITNSSGTISLTKANVTSALGYTPPTTDTNTWRGIQNNLTSSSTTDSLSAAQGKALKGLVDAKAPLASPALTGTPTAPTAAASTNSTQIATTAFVKNVLSSQIKNGRAKVEIGAAGVWLASEGHYSSDKQASLGIYGGDDGNSEIAVTAEGLYPTADKYCSLGYASVAWKRAYSYSWNNASDRRMKQDINYDMSKYLAVFDSLKPCEFRYKDDPGEVHTGIIAQDVLDAMGDVGINNSATIETENDAGLLFARYTEFIGILIAKVQDLQRQVDELKAGGN